MGEVAEFFDAQQKGAAYKSLKSLTRSQDQAAAEIMNAEVRGRALSVGGVWEFFAQKPQLSELTCLDLSEAMLKTYAPPGAKAAVGDLFEIELPAQSFDSVVFSLILHHVAQGGWSSCEKRVSDALSRARSWLKPGGVAFIIEYCPAPAWMPAQRLLLPFTRLFLKLSRQPMVVMHPVSFYEKAMNGAGFSQVVARRIEAPGAGDWTWFPVFMGVPWLKMPLKFYPKMHILTGVKQGGGS